MVNGRGEGRRQGEEKVRKGTGEVGGKEDM